MNKQYSIIFVIVSILIVLLLIFGNNFLAINDTDKYHYHYTYDTIPEKAPDGLLEHIDSQSQRMTTLGKKILNVQPLIWHHGCSPTSYGMVLWYYDFNYGTNIMNGNPYECTASIEHYNEYSLPIDTYSNILSDCSETPLDCHADNCIADCLRTSRSSRGLYYGMSYFPGAIIGFINEAEYYPDIDFYGSYFNPSDPRYADITYEFIRSEIEQDRPVIIQIPGHISVAMAYDDSTQEIGYLTTWSDKIAWYPMQGENGEWYVKGILFIDFGFGPAPPPPDPLTCYKRIDNNLVISMETYEDVCPTGWCYEWPNGDIPGFGIIIMLIGIILLVLERKVKL